MTLLARAKNFWAYVRQSPVAEMLRNGPSDKGAKGWLEQPVYEDLPASRSVILYTIGAFFILFLLWANFATLDEVARGQGKVVPSRDTQRVQSLEGGLVEELLVREGDAVKAGQILVRLRAVQATSDLESRRKQYLSLQAKAMRLKAQAEGLETPVFDTEVAESVPESVNEERQAFAAARKNLDSQIEVLVRQRSQRQQEIRELQTRIADLREVIALSREEMRMIEPVVERGAAPKIELIQLQRGIKEKQTELNSLQTSLPRAESAVAEAEAKIEEISNGAKSEAQNELSSVMIEMNGMGDTLSALKDRQVRTELRSPVDGIVQQLKANTIGGVVKPGDDVVEIIPQDDQLIVEVRIRPADIAFLHPGQKAVVKITAYDFSVYGGLKGEVVEISPDTLTDDKGETFYRVRIETDGNSLRRENRILPIIPGMVASADILTGEKTVMDYILKPLIKTLDQAMNER